MSIMLLEVASLGVPLICSDIPANGSVLPAEAIYFSSENVEDLYNKLVWALDHPAEMASRAAHIQRWVREHFGWRDIVRQYEALYEMLLESVMRNA